MSMARYSSMAADSSARACSRWPSLGIQRAEAAVAVGLERAHAQFLGQGEGLAVVGFGLLALRGLAPRRNVAEEAQGIRLVAPFLVRTGERQRPLGEGLRLLQAAGQQLRLPQGETDRAPDTVLLPMPVLCSIACVSSGTASATRPARVYAAPKAAAIQGKRPGGPRPDRGPRPVRAGGAPWAGRLGGGTAARSPKRPA